MGETVVIQHRLTSIEDVVAGDISFTAVYKGGGDEIETVIVAYDPLVDGLDTRETAMTFPADAPEGLYSIIADQAGSENYGESGPFWIYRESTGAAITLEQPYPGQRFFPGSMIELKYYFSRPVEFGMMTFDLYTMESATPVSSATLNYEIPSDYSRPGFRFFYSMRIPPGISSDHCFIVATHPNGMGTSNTFIIQPIGDGGDSESVPRTDTPASLHIGTHRGTGVEFHPGETIGVTIEIIGGERTIPSFPSIGELQGGIGSVEMFLLVSSLSGGGTSCAPFMDFYSRSEDGRRIYLRYTLPSHSYDERLILRAVYEGLENQTHLYIVPEVTLDMAIPFTVTAATGPAISFVWPEPGVVLRNGSRPNITWEIEKEPGSDLDLQTIVILKDESTGDETVLGNVLSAAAGPGSNSRGHFIWHVGRMYHPRSGELGSRRRVDLDPGRYSIIVRMAENPEISAESGVFSIE